MDEELKKYLDEINSKLDRILELLTLKPASDIEEESENKNVEAEVEEFENELLNEIKEKGWQFVYKSYLVKRLQEKGLSFDDFIKYSRLFYEKEKDKFYPVE
ncbi:MAG: hypothetical protein ACP5GJ_03985 [Nanopusillaceae archaeon]